MFGEILFVVLLFCLLGAVVTGPLFSISASGKLADAMVHFPWKGRAVVRKWLKPSNPKTTDQGDARLILGGLGRSCSPVHTASQYAVDAREVVDPGQTWVSSFVKYCRDTFMPTAAAFEATRDAMVATGETAKFDSEGEKLGLVEFDVTYKGTSSAFSLALFLYMLGVYGCARYAADNTKFNRVPFKTAMVDWTSTEIDQLVALLPSL